MTNQIPLRPATEEETADCLAHSLQYDGKRRITRGADLMARITAERQVEHLLRSGFVLMRRPPLDAPSASGHGPAP